MGVCVGKETRASAWLSMNSTTLQPQPDLKNHVKGSVHQTEMAEREQLGNKWQIAQKLLEGSG